MSSGAMGGAAGATSAEAAADAVADIVGFGAGVGLGLRPALEEAVGLPEAPDFFESSSLRRAKITTPPRRTAPRAPSIQRRGGFDSLLLAAANGAPASVAFAAAGSGF